MILVNKDPRRNNSHNNHKRVSNKEIYWLSYSSSQPSFSEWILQPCWVGWHTSLLCFQRIHGTHKNLDCMPPYNFDRAKRRREVRLLLWSGVVDVTVSCSESKLFTDRPSSRRYSKTASLPMNSDWMCRWGSSSCRSDGSILPDEQKEAKTSQRAQRWDINYTVMNKVNNIYLSPLLK